MAYAEFRRYLQDPSHPVSVWTQEMKEDIRDLVADVDRWWDKESWDGTMLNRWTRILLLHR
jgi:hypothetical protein